MPNQNNYRTDLRTKTQSRFTVSRIINVPDATILNEEIVGSFAFDREDNIEIHCYSTITNQLILSTVIKLSDNIIKSHIVAYDDGTFKNYIRIDFTKLFVDKDLILVPGDYRMVLNFFSDEIGTYDNRKLNIDVISDSRTEVQVSFNDTTDEVSLRENLYLLKEFIEKAFNKSDAVGAAEKIFKSGVELNDSTEGLTAENIEQNISIPSANQTEQQTLQRINQINAKQIFDQQLNNFLLELFKFVREEIVINGDDRIQETEFQDLIRNVVTNKISKFAQLVDNRIQVT